MVESYRSFVSSMPASILAAQAKSANVSNAKVVKSFGDGLDQYILFLQRTVGRVRTILSRDETFSVSDIYVKRTFDAPQHFKQKFYLKDEPIAESLLMDLIVDDKISLIIQGTAGSGKTLSVKNLVSGFIPKNTNQIPIFFELRKLQTDPSASLVKHIVQSVSAYVPYFNEETFTFGLQSGSFVVILDGLDEIPYAMRTWRGIEIRDLMQRSRSSIVITTRPDDIYASWTDGPVLRIIPLDYDGVVKQIEKTPVRDLAAKEAYLSALTPAFYRRHEGYITTPLMSLLMFMTYREVAEIPNRLHLFFDQAYQVLFWRFDSTKDVQRRTLATGLDIDDFRKVLSAFCFLSYIEEKFVFLDNQLYEIVKRASQVSQVRINPEYFIHDASVSLSLLQRDGFFMSFVHRSFQEFFAADFIARNKLLEFPEIVRHVVSRSRTDNVLVFLQGLDEPSLARAWLIPALERLLTQDAMGEGWRESAIALYPSMTLGEPARLEAASADVDREFTRIARVVGGAALKFLEDNASSGFRSDATLIIRHLVNEAKKKTKVDLRGGSKIETPISIKFDALPEDIRKNCRGISVLESALIELQQALQGAKQRQNYRADEFYNVVLDSLRGRAATERGVAHDVFISYSREDSAQVKVLVTELKAANFSVWWDQNIAGERFRDKILDEITKAKSLLVVWSPNSIKSDWVRAEAEIGRVEGKLLCVKTPGVGYRDIPPPFTEYGAIDIHDPAKINAALRRLCG